MRANRNRDGFRYGLPEVLAVRTMRANRNRTLTESLVTEVLAVRTMRANRNAGRAAVMKGQF